MDSFKSELKDMAGNFLLVMTSFGVVAVPMLIVWAGAMLGIIPAVISFFVAIAAFSVLAEYAP